MRGKVVFVSSSSQKNLLSVKETKRQVGQLNCFSLQSFMALSGFADPNGFREDFAYVHFALILTFLFLLSICLFPVISVFISPFSSFFLNLPFADSFCLCDLPCFIQPVCSYRNRVFAAGLFVHACSHSCSHFLSSSNF